MLSGKRVLIIGGTGSLGRALVTRLLSGVHGTPESITVFSRDELKQHEMRLEYIDNLVATDEIIYQATRCLKFMIGDIRDRDDVRLALNSAEVVFNVAALKQVPTIERFPWQAVETNITGSHNIIQCIREGGHKVEVVITPSSDKAAKPINVYGATKMIQERMLIEANLNPHGTKFIGVRYGNVIASRGSVIPLFQSQIKAGGPVTITSPDMTRFLLTLDQAVDTLMVAYNGNTGEIFVPRIPSAYVTDIARAMMNGSTCDIKVIGIRPGEKLHEVLITEEEVLRTCQRNGYYIIQPILPELRPVNLKQSIGTEYSSATSLVSLSYLESLLEAWR